MYRLETDVFQLELEPEVFGDDIKYTENTILHINVNSYGFSAKATMDMDVKELAAFAKELLVSFIIWQSKIGRTIRNV